MSSIIVNQRRAFKNNNHSVDIFVEHNWSFCIKFSNEKKGHRNVDGVGGGVEFPLESEVAGGVGVHQTGHLRTHLFKHLSFLSFSIFYSHQTGHLRIHLFKTWESFFCKTFFYIFTLSFIHNFLLSTCIRQDTWESIFLNNFFVIFYFLQ